MNTEIVKGFKDYTGEEAEKRQKIKGILARTFRKYGFELAETPIIENEEFVKGGNANDDAVSDTYKLKDKGDRKLALRYEFTFQLKRIAKDKKLPYKRYQIGEVFRDEPSSSNRFRQFTQCDVDIIGATIRDEAEILALANEALNNLAIKPVILVNNRKLLNEILDDLKITKDREQILRELDKIEYKCTFKEKDVANNLKKLKAEKILLILKKSESYFKKYKAYKEVLELKKNCSYYGLKVLFCPTLVRGLSYYNGSVFEIKTKKIGDSICGGGSYMINGLQSTGISFGLERVSQFAKITLDEEKILVISLAQDKEAIKLADKLRKKGKDVTLYYGKPSKALEYANSKNIMEVIFIGKEEVKRKKYKIKDMKTGKEKALKI